jgi:hypothetical protein
MMLPSAAAAAVVPHDADLSRRRDVAAASARSARADVEQFMAHRGGFAPDAAPAAVGGAVTDTRFVRRHPLTRAWGRIVSTTARVLGWHSIAVRAIAPSAAAFAADHGNLARLSDVAPALLLTAGDQLWIPVRGSASIAAWVVEGREPSVTAKGRHADLNAVAGRLWNALLPQLDTILARPGRGEKEPRIKSVHLTGHSHGAALATLLAEKVAAHLGAAPPGVEVRLWTFGSPRVYASGTTALQAFDARVRHVRIVNRGDGVAHTPVHLGGDRVFAHAGAEYAVEIGGDRVLCIGNVAAFPATARESINAHKISTYVHNVDTFAAIAETR